MTGPALGVIDKTIDLSDCSPGARGVAADADMTDSIDNRTCVDSIVNRIA